MNNIILFIDLKDFRLSRIKNFQSFKNYDRFSELVRCLLIETKYFGGIKHF